MSSSPSTSQCWRAARPCPASVTSSSAQNLVCRAWFRCEVAGDYIIRWRCQSLEDGEVNITSATGSLCPEQVDTGHVTECPPPIVCPEEPFREEAAMASSSLSSDVILTIAVAFFALLAMILIIVSSYKYWTLRKRLRLRLQPQHYMIRDFPYPVRYHSLWGTGYHHPGYDPDQGRQTPYSRSYGSPCPDVYFAPPQESPRYFQRLLSSSDSSVDNPSGEYGHPAPRARDCRGRHGRKTDPTVATASFVFHQPLGLTGAAEVKDRGRTENWVHHNRQVNKDSDSEKSLECYHIYKGNLSKFRPPEHHYATGNCGNYRSEYHHLTNPSTDFTKAPRVSSIAIPSFDFSSLHKSRYHYDPRKQEHHVREHHTAADQVYTQHNYDSDSSQGSRHPTGPPLAHTTRARSYNNMNSDGPGKEPPLYSVPEKSNKGHLPHCSSHLTNPDVINSHNFTNKFVRVGKNIYRPLVTKSASGSSITMNNNNNNNHGDLSYDSFRDEHLRELAKEGAASSSTLEAGYRQKSHEKVPTLNTRH